MADDGTGSDGVKGQEGSDPKSGGKTPDAAGQDGSDGKQKLEGKTSEELVTIIRETRQEAKKARERYEKAEGNLGDLTKRFSELEKKVKTHEDEKKTAEQKAAEERQALEAKAGIADSLQPYADHVKSELDAEMKRIEAIEDAEAKKAYTDLLSTFGENDHLARLRAVRAIRAVEARKVEVSNMGNEGHPGTVGLGKTEKSLLSQIGWDPGAMKAARLVGDLPKEPKSK